MEKVNSWIRGSLIGAGAFGNVNLALNRENGELFVVKSIECKERMNNKMQAMKNEVQILQCLDSPFIVKSLGLSFSVENGKSMRNVFLVYMLGGGVADLMKKFGGHFEEPWIRNYTCNILEAIWYLHAQDIVHYDIKGRHMPMGSIGEVKLANFWGARRLNGDPAIMVDYDLLKIKGTPLWMAPEVVQQVKPGLVSDIWLLGCTMVKMATGKAPWSNIVSAHNPFVALYHIVCTKEVPKLPSCLSRQGQDFLSKCFQRDPGLRWTAAQLLQHPFITNNFFTIQSNKATETHLMSSPTSTFNFPNRSGTSFTLSIVNSIPILKSPQFTKRFCPQQQQTNFFQTEVVLVKHKEITTTISSSFGIGFWCNSPLNDLPGQCFVGHTPKTISPIETSPTCSSDVELIPRVEETESTILISQEFCKNPSLEVKEDISAISSCAPTGTGICIIEDDEQQRESMEITKEQASCSTAQQSSTSCGNWNKKVLKDDTMHTQESRKLGRGVGCGCLNSSTTKPRKKKLLSSWPDHARLEKCYYPDNATATTIEDPRCTNTLERPQLKNAA